MRSVPALQSPAGSSGGGSGRSPRCEGAACCSGRAEGDNAAGLAGRARGRWPQGRGVRDTVRDPKSFECQGRRRPAKRIPICHLRKDTSAARHRRCFPGGSSAPGRRERHGCHRRGAGAHARSCDLVSTAGPSCRGCQGSSGGASGPYHRTRGHPECRGRGRSSPLSLSTTRGHRGDMALSLNLLN